jgi:hypothetical protein
VTYTTFQVRDVIKGAVGSTHTIKQIGGAIPGEAVQYRVQGIPTFNVGQEYVVFLAAPSSLGFSSPMGLAQGRFTVHDGPNAKQVSNGRDFRDLTERISAKVPAAARDHIKNSGGPVRALDIDDFKKTVRAHLGAKP